jgi:hypothetical protein
VTKSLIPPEAGECQSSRPARSRSDTTMIDQAGIGDSYPLPGSHDGNVE